MVGCCGAGGGVWIVLTVWEYLWALSIVSVPWSSELVSTGAYLPVDMYVDVVDTVRRDQECVIVCSITIRRKLQWIYIWQTSKSWKLPKALFRIVDDMLTGILSNVICYNVRPEDWRNAYKQWCDVCSAACWWNIWLSFWQWQWLSYWGCVLLEQCLVLATGSSTQFSSILSLESVVSKHLCLTIQIIVNMKRCKSNTTKFYYGVTGQINDNMFRP